MSTQVVQIMNKYNSFAHKHTANKKSLLRSIYVTLYNKLDFLLCERYFHFNLVLYLNKLLSTSYNNNNNTKKEFQFFNTYI